jgi:hypothetical protein
MAQSTKQTSLHCKQKRFNPSELDQAIETVSRLRFVGELYVKDLTNNIICTAKIAEPEEEGMFMSLFKKAETVDVKDINRIQITIEKEGKIVSQGQ